MTRATSLIWIDYAVMLIYFAFVLGIGFALKRYMRTSTDFFFRVVQSRPGLRALLFSPPISARRK